MVSANLRNSTDRLTGLKGQQMSKFEYDLQEFKLVEKWNPKKQAEKLAELRGELNRKGDEGWELLGLHSFDLVGGITGSNKGKVTLTVWKQQIG